MNDNDLCAVSGPLRFQILRSGIISCNAVVLWHEQTRDAVLIDPTDDAKGVIAFARERKLSVHNVTPAPADGHVREELRREREVPTSLDGPDVL